MYSNLPYWLLKNGIIGNFPSIYEDLNTEIVILGGGFTGILMAYQSILKGYDTILIDNNHIGFNQSVNSSGFIYTNLDVSIQDLIVKHGKEKAKIIYHECLDAITHLKNIIQENNIDCDFLSKDALHYAAFKKDVKFLQEEYKMCLKNDIPVQWFDTNEISAIYGIQNTHGGIFTHYNASFDPLKFLSGLLQVCIEKGLKVYDNTQIDKIQHAARTITITTKDKIVVKGKKIIYCNGVQNIPKHLQEFLKPVQNNILVSESLSINELLYMKDIFLRNTEVNYFYFGILKENRLLVGQINDQDNDKVDYSEQIEKRVRHHLQFNTKMDFSWQHKYLVSKDNLPLIGSIDQVQSGFTVLPTGGNGYIYSIIAMRIFDDMMQNKNNVCKEIFDINRFN